MTEPEQTSERSARLTSMLRRARAGRLSPESWLLVAGSALVVGGVVLIIVGWVGASRTVLVAGQIPYLVSGGLLGLALVVLGGFLYFGYWLAVLVRQVSIQSDRNALVAERFEVAAHSLSDIAASLSENPTAGRERRSRSRASRPLVLSAEALVATPSGTMAHRPDCPIVANRQDLRDVTASATGMEACGICAPALS